MSKEFKEKSSECIDKAFAFLKNGNKGLSDEDREQPPVQEKVEQVYFSYLDDRSKLFNHINLTRLAKSCWGADFFEIFKQHPAVAEDVVALSWQWQKCGLLDTHGRRNVQLLAQEGLVKPLRTIWERVQYIFDPNDCHTSKNSFKFPPMLQMPRGQMLLDQIFAAYEKAPAVVIAAAEQLSKLPKPSSTEEVETCLSQHFAAFSKEAKLVPPQFFSTENGVSKFPTPRFGFGQRKFVFHLQPVAENSFLFNCFEAAHKIGLTDEEDFATIDDCEGSLDRLIMGLKRLEEVSLLPEQLRLPLIFRRQALKEMAANPHYAPAIATLYICLYSLPLRHQLDMNLQLARNWFVRAKGVGVGIARNFENELPLLCQGLKRLKELGLLELPHAQCYIDAMVQMSPVMDNYVHWAETQAAIFYILSERYEEENRQDLLATFRNEVRLEKWREPCEQLAKLPCGKFLYAHFKTFPAGTEDLFLLSSQLQKCGLLEGEQGVKNVRFLMQNRLIVKPLCLLWNRLSQFGRDSDNKDSKSTLVFQQWLTTPGEGQKFLEKIFAGFQKDSSTVFAAARVLHMSPLSSSPETVQSCLQQIFSSAKTKSTSEHKRPPDEKNSADQAALKEAQDLVANFDKLECEAKKEPEKVETEKNILKSISAAINEDFIDTVSFYLSRGWIYEVLLINDYDPKIGAPLIPVWDYFHKAVEAGSIKTARLLLDHSANPDRIAEKELVKLVQLQKVEWVRLLLTYDPDPHAALQEAATMYQQKPTPALKEILSMLLKSPILEGIDKLSSMAGVNGVNDILEAFYPSSTAVQASQQPLVARGLAYLGQASWLPVQQQTAAFNEMVANPHHALTIAILYACLYSPALKDNYESNIKRFEARYGLNSVDELPWLCIGLKALKDQGLLELPDAQNYINTLLELEWPNNGDGKAAAKVVINQVARKKATVNSAPCPSSSPSPSHLPILAVSCATLGLPSAARPMQPSASPPPSNLGEGCKGSAN